ncbi:MAG: hypothetical protein Tsb008_10500 [Rhodothalassiaceae bacterium]
MLAVLLLLFGPGPLPVLAQTGKDEPPTLAGKMEAALKASLWSEAGSFAEELIAGGGLDRDSLGRAHFARGMAALSSGDTAQARAAFDRALGLVDDPAQVLFERFQLAWSAQDWVTSAEDLSRIARLTPERARSVSLSAIMAIVRELERLGNEEDRLFDLLVALRDAAYSGSPPDSRPDDLYRLLARHLIERGRRFEAEAVIEVIRKAETIFAMMTDRRDSGLWPALDRMFGQRAEGITLRELELLARMRKAMPNSLGLIRDSIEALRRHGLSREAASFGLQAIKAYTHSPQGTFDHRAFEWIVNETAYALLDIGETEQAIALLGALVTGREGAAIPVSQQINYGAVLWLSGRFENAIRAATEAEAGMVSGYGQSFIRQIAVCAYAALGRLDEAEAAAGPLIDHPMINPSATQIALLCLDRHEEGVAQLLSRLSNPDLRQDALVALLPRQLEHEKSTLFRELQARNDRIRADPRIRDKQAEVGRPLALVIRQVYWGAF